MRKRNCLAMLAMAIPPKLSLRLRETFFVCQTNKENTLAPAKWHLEPITLQHLILSGTIDVTSALIIIPVTINSSKGTVTQPLHVSTEIQSLAQLRNTLL